MDHVGYDGIGKGRIFYVKKIGMLILAMEFVACTALQAWQRDNTEDLGANSGAGGIRQTALRDGEGRGLHAECRGSGV